MFRKNKLTNDDSKIIEIIKSFLENKIELGSLQKYEFRQFDEWDKVVVFEESIWFYHKLSGSFGFLISEDNKNLIFRNHHRETKYQRMGDGTFILNKLTQLFKEICIIKRFSVLIILFEIWEIENPSSESVRKFLQKNNYIQTKERDPEEWMLRISF